MEHRNKGKNIQSVQRAIDIINCFNDSDIELSLNEITEKLVLNKSTVHGIINTLHNNRYLQQNSNGNYMLGQALFNKSIYAIHASKSRLRSLSKSYMTRISNKYKCTSHVFALEGTRLQFLDMALPINSYYVISPALSDVMHLYCTASGKIVLSYMSIHERNEYFERTDLKPHTPKTLVTKEDITRNIDSIIEKGYSLENEEIEEGCISIAVPILTCEESLFGTLSITGSKVKVHGKEEEIVQDLMDASKRIASQIFDTSS